MKKKHAKIDSLQGLRLILFLTIFFFHTSMFPKINNESKIYHFIMSGGGTLAVAYFFALSGFVAALSENGKDVIDIKSYMKYLKRRICHFYSYHLIFLIAIIPLYRSHFEDNTRNSITKLIWSISLLQSWNPDRSVWLGYNGVAWFLSASVFLTFCTPIIYKIWVTIQNHPYSKMKSE